MEISDIAPTTFLSQPKAFDWYYASSNILIECEVESNPQSTLELLLNNSKIKESQNGKIIHQFSLDKFQVGSYVCKATNRLGSLLSPPAIIREARKWFI